jgi:hypothetical protein
VTRRTAVLAALLLALMTDLVLGGCVSLPHTGAVRTRSIDADAGGDTLVDFIPAGPRAGSSPVQLVESFLTAMTATPLDTSVARQFLAPRSRRGWDPARGTVVYSSQQLAAGPPGNESTVTLRLRDVVELDARGGWLGAPTSAHGRDYRLRLTRVHGQWRITDPPDRLLIPRTHLDTQYQQFFLYFVDPSAQVVVPEPVYVPRGTEAPTLLVAGLLRGVAPRLADVERTYLPDASPSPTVTVDREGTAVVPLASEVRSLAGPALRLLFTQLAWTLGQVPGVQQLEVTAGGSPVVLPGSGARVGVDGFTQADPSVAWASTGLFGVRGSRVVELGSQGEDRVSGPFGALPLAPRAVAVDLLGQHVAGVTSDGRSVVAADRDGVPGRAARVSDAHTVYRGGTDVLRPSYDLHGQLWIVDRTRSGARLSVVRQGVARTVRAPGLTGARVQRLLVSRDGTRLVAVVRRGGQDQLLVARVRRDSAGEVVGIVPARRLMIEGAPDRMRDVAWRTPTRLAVLVARSAATSEVLLANIDGSSTPQQLSTDSSLFRGRAVRVLTSPTPATPIYLLTTTGRLFTLSGRGQWTASSIRPGLEAPSFVG